MTRIKAGGGRKNGEREGKAKGKERRTKGRKEGRKQGRQEARHGLDRILRGCESDTAEREMQFVAASVAVESQPRVDR